MENENPLKDIIIEHGDEGAPDEKPKKKGGRPKGSKNLPQDPNKPGPGRPVIYKFSKEQLDFIESLSQYNVSNRAMTALLGCSLSRFETDIYDEQSDLYVSYWKGKGTMEVHIRKQLYEAAMKGDYKALRMIVELDFGLKKSADININNNNQSLNLLNGLDLDKLTQEELMALKEIIQKSQKEELGK